MSPPCPEYPACDARDPAWRGFLLNTAEDYDDPPSIAFEEIVRAAQKKDRHAIFNVTALPGLSRHLLTKI